MFNFPEYKTVLFKQNPETGKYEKQPERVPFNKLPFELKVETTRDERIRANGATEIITGRIKGGKRLFFTGLLHVYNSKVNFYGNDYENTPQGKRNSLVIFQFSQDNAHLRIFYFNHYYIHNSTERLLFVANLLKHKGDM